MCGRGLPEAIPREGNPSNGRRQFETLLLGEEDGREREFGWYLYGSRAYRAGKWKIVWGVTAKRWELYDMDADRTETRDRAAELPDRVRQLAASWQAWAQRSEVP